MEKTVIHTIEPVFDENSRVLILGTIPSPRSREKNFFYSHPQNRFFRILSDLFSCALPETNEEKRDMLLIHRVALWDVLSSCTIEGADDASIKNAVPNDLSRILKRAGIRAIFTTGKKATQLYRQLIFEKTGVESVYLPSTSPANCRFFTYDELLGAYREILKYLTD